jgi:hypothetical protein
MEVTGTTHVNFSDTPLSSPLRHLTGAGSIDARRCFQIINGYTTGFLDRNLKGKETPLLGDSPSTWPEVRAKNWPASKGGASKPRAADPTPAQKGTAPGVHE